jgi:hypothetical protein
MLNDIGPPDMIVSRKLCWHNAGVGSPSSMVSSLNRASSKAVPSLLYERFEPEWKTAISLSPSFQTTWQDVEEYPVLWVHYVGIEYARNTAASSLSALFIGTILGVLMGFFVCCWWCGGCDKRLRSAAMRSSREHEAISTALWRRQMQQFQNYRQDVILRMLTSGVTSAVPAETDMSRAPRRMARVAPLPVHVQPAVTVVQPQVLAAHNITSLSTRSLVTPDTIGDDTASSGPGPFT